jgi:hypothetical protein
MSTSHYYASVFFTDLTGFFTDAIAQYKFCITLHRGDQESDVG